MPTVHTGLQPVPARRHPHQVLIAALLFTTGLPILFGTTRPGSLNETLPPWLVLVWAAGLTLCGALVVIAAIIKNELHALYLELTADLPLSLLCWTYAVAVITTAGTRGLAAGGIVAGAAIAFGLRYQQVSTDLRALRGLPARRQPTTVIADLARRALRRS